MGARTAAWLCAACACGCASAPHPDSSPAPREPPPTPESITPAFDWRALLVVPFGTLLKDMPLALDEVIMFRDAAGAAACEAPSDAESGDCFSMDGASPPQILARRPDSYLLCFEHDRLRRIETSVHVAESESEPLLGALCAQWLGRARDTARTADSCAGREGTVEWRARRAQGADSSATLSITLIDARPPPRD
jgi:hypothetical protein